MNISECINRLIEIREKNGEVKVYFDCPECKTSFTPDTVITMAIHMTEENKKRK